MATTIDDGSNGGRLGWGFVDGGFKKGGRRGGARCVRDCGG